METSDEFTRKIEEVMMGVARNKLIAVCCFLCLTAAAFAQKARTAAVMVPTSSNEAKEIVKAQTNWMGADIKGHVIVPLFIRKNDAYAYLVARVRNLSQASQTNDAFYITAILERRNGEWTSDGYMPVKPSPVDSIKEMCKYGDGIGASVFRECAHAR
jgi:hypothetical protein